MGKSISDYFDRRYKNNPYVNKNNRSQYPKRMYRPPKPCSKEEVIYGNRIPTEEEFDRILRESQNPSETIMTGTAPLNNQPDKYDVPEHLTGIALSNRHRYGDELDILRSKFTRTKEEIEKEKFKLIIAARNLLGKIFWTLRTVPKTERYVLGSYMRECGYTVLRNSIAIKKRFYRKNLLEQIDIELDVLRELYRHSHLTYPQWIEENTLRDILHVIDGVGTLISGLLKSTVC